MMNPVNISGKKNGFELLQTAGSCQTAVINLDPGEATSEELNRHPESEQVMLILEGGMTGHVGEERITLRVGDVFIVPKNAPHKFSNDSDKPAKAFTTYSPPEY